MIAQLMLHGVPSVTGLTVQLREWRKAMNNEQYTSKRHNERVPGWLNKVGELAGGAAGPGAGAVRGFSPANSVGTAAAGKLIGAAATMTLLKLLRPRPSAPRSSIPVQTRGSVLPPQPTSA